MVLSPAKDLRVREFKEDRLLTWEIPPCAVFLREEGEESRRQEAVGRRQGAWGRELGEIKEEGGRRKEEEMGSRKEKEVHKSSQKESFGFQTPYDIILRK